MLFLFKKKSWFADICVGINGKKIYLFYSHTSDNSIVTIAHIEVQHQVTLVESSLITPELV